jgi:hypothetical protein
VLVISTRKIADSGCIYRAEYPRIDEVYL